MEASATVTSKGQVTIPARVRDAIGIRPGARLLFRVENDHVVIEEPISGRRAEVRRFPDFFQLAGSVPVPSTLKDASWPAIRRLAREQRARR
jgi:AbrB family looped-hinge helix DNA binding protein